MSPRLFTLSPRIRSLSVVTPDLFRGQLLLFFENYVTFDSRTYVAPGDWIYLYDSADKLIGAYTGYELSGKTVIVRTNTLKVVLESNDDNQQGWGYAIDKIEHMPYEVLFPLLNDVRRKKK